MQRGTRTLNGWLNLECQLVGLGPFWAFGLEFCDSILEPNICRFTSVTDICTWSPRLPKYGPSLVTKGTPSDVICTIHHSSDCDT